MRKIGQSFGREEPPEEIRLYGGAMKSSLLQRRKYTPFFEIADIFGWNHIEFTFRRINAQKIHGGRIAQLASENDESMAIHPSKANERLKASSGRRTAQIWTGLPSR